MRTYSRFARVLVVAVGLFCTATLGASVRVKAPLLCTRGPSGQTYAAVVTLPPSAPTGSTFIVRIDSLSSGVISHIGLNYIFDMTSDYPIPTGTTYVSGSARVVPNTGTANVRQSARVWHDTGGIHVALPGHVLNGTSFTTPSIEYAVTISAPAGSELAIQFSHYQVTANAFLIGNVHTTCEPRPKPFTLATVRVDPPASPP